MTTPGHETNDADRLADWHHEHGRAVRGFLRAMVRRDDLADDLCQEVFSRAWQARGRYREQGVPRAYLLQIADRLVCDRARRRQPETNLDDEAWRRHEPASRAEEPWQAVMLREETQQLTAALDQLSPVQQRVLLLRYYGQMGFAEIAEAVGCPLNTTLSHCHRGLQTLRKILIENVP